MRILFFTLRIIDLFLSWSLIYFIRSWWCQSIFICFNRLFYFKRSRLVYSFLLNYLVLLLLITSHFLFSFTIEPLLWLFDFLFLNHLFFDYFFFFFRWFLFIFLLVLNLLQSGRPRFNHFNIFFKFVFDRSHVMFNFIFILHKCFLLSFDLTTILFFIPSKVFTMEFSINSNLPSDILNLIKLRNISNNSFDY